MESAVGVMSDGRLLPTFAYEAAIWDAGTQFVAGIDEVGRGPLAGPLLAAAVVLPPGADFPWLAAVRDSKQLTAQQRQALDRLIRGEAVAFGIGQADHHEVDRLGLIQATRVAMQRAIARLDVSIDHLLIDALTLPDVPLQQTPIIHGDALSLSIACASIVAKVERDRLMALADAEHPGYAFASNKGYPTSEHLAALASYGVCPIHRRSFAPVRAILTARA